MFTSEKRLGFLLHTRSCFHSTNVELRSAVEPGTTLGFRTTAVKTRNTIPASWHSLKEGKSVGCINILVRHLRHTQTVTVTFWDSAICLHPVLVQAYPLQSILPWMIYTALLRGRALNDSCPHIAGLWGRFREQQKPAHKAWPSARLLSVRSNTSRWATLTFPRKDCFLILGLVNSWVQILLGDGKFSMS